MAGAGRSKGEETVKAREKFLHNLRKVAGFLSPELHINGIRLGPEAMQQALVRRGVWPLPQTVDGFDPSDFPDLAPQVRQRPASKLWRLSSRS